MPIEKVQPDRTAVLQLKFGGKIEILCKGLDLVV